jgi:hypothetical protein
VPLRSDTKHPVAPYQPDIHVMKVWSTDTHTCRPWREQQRPRPSGRAPSPSDPRCLRHNCVDVRGDGTTFTCRPRASLLPDISLRVMHLVAWRECADAGAVAHEEHRVVLQHGEQHLDEIYRRRRVCHPRDGRSFACHMLVQMNASNPTEHR